MNHVWQVTVEIDDGTGSEEVAGAIFKSESGANNYADSYRESIRPYEVYVTKRDVHD